VLKKKKGNAMKNLTIWLLAILLSGCTSFAYTNKRFVPDETYSGRASFNIKEDRGNKKVLTLCKQGLESTSKPRL